MTQVSIPRLEPRSDPVTGKSYFVFMVQVRLITRDNKQVLETISQIECEFCCCLVEYIL